MNRRLMTSLVGATALVLAGGPAAGRGSADGIYTAQQAEEGGRLYAVQCAMCHGAQLQGTVETPGLAGKFVADWAGKPVGDLFDYIGRAMPLHAPGTLSAPDNARLVAFLLQANGAPSGNRALPDTSRALRRIDFDAAEPSG